MNQLEFFSKYRVSLRVKARVARLAYNNSVAEIGVCKGSVSLRE